MADQRIARGHLFAFLTIIVWGTTFVSTKILLLNFSPIDILLYRFFIGFLILLALRPRHLKLANWKQEALCAAAGLTGVLLYFLLENIALVYASASNVGVIVAVSPLFTALLSALFLRDEKLSSTFFVGFIVALLGIFCISFEGIAAGSVGDILALLAAFVWAIYSILTRKMAAFGYDSIQLTKRTFAWGLVMMLPLLIPFGFTLGFERFVDPLNMANMLFLGVGASALCFVTWNLVIKVLGAVKTSAYIYLVPVVTVAASVVILHEPLTLPIVVGITLTCMGLVLSEWGRNLPSRIKNKRK